MLWQSWSAQGQTNVASITTFVKGGFWLTAAGVFGKFLGFLTIPVLARVLGPAQLGVFNIFFSLSQSGQQLSSLGMEVATQRAGAQHEKIGGQQTGEIFAASLLLSAAAACIVSAGLFIFRRPLAESWYAQPELAGWIACSALVVILFPLGNTALLYLASLQEFRRYAFRSITASLLSALIPLLGAFYSGLAGAVWGMIVAAAAQVLWTWYLVRVPLRNRSVELRFRNAIPRSAELLRIGLPHYFGMTLLGSVAGVFLLGLVSQRDTMVELGYLRVAQSLSTIIGFIPVSTAPVVVSTLSALIATDSQNYRRLKAAHFKLTWALLLIPAASMFPLLPFLVRGVFGQGYISAVLLSGAFLWIAVIASLGSTLILYAVVRAQTLHVAWAGIVGIASLVVGAVVLVPRFGALGYLMAQAIGNLVGLFMLLPVGIGDIDLSDKKALSAFLICTVLAMAVSFHMLNVQFSVTTGLLCSVLIGGALATILFRVGISTPEKTLLKEYALIKFRGVYSRS